MSCLRRAVGTLQCRLARPVDDQFQSHRSYVRRTRLSPGSRTPLSVDHVVETESLGSHGLETYTRRHTDIQIDRHTDRTYNS